MTRRAFLTLPAVLVTQTDVTGVSVTGQLLDDTSDLQAGYFSLCGTGTGQCRATDAIGISVHPQNVHVLPVLQRLVGRDVTFAIRES